MPIFFFILSRQGKTPIKKTSREGAGIDLVDEIKHSKKSNFQVFDKSGDLEEDGWISAVGEEDDEFGGSQIKPETKKVEFGRSQIKTPKSQIKADATPATSSPTSNKVLTQIYIYEKSSIFPFLSQS